MIKITEFISDSGNKFFWQEEIKTMYFLTEYDSIERMPPDTTILSLSSHVPIATMEDIEVDSIDDLIEGNK